MRKLITALTVICFLGVFAQSNQVMIENGKFYSLDGKLYSGLYTKIEDNNKVSELNIKDGNLSGPAKYFSLTGAVKEIGMYKEGKRHGEWKKFNDAGQLLSIASFNNDAKNGKWLVWDNNGKLRFEMFYNNGKQVGTWKLYDEEGNVSTKDFGQ